MPKGDKYIGLYTYLMQCGEDSVTLTFSEIEGYTGVELPPSTLLCGMISPNACSWGSKGSGGKEFIWDIHYYLYSGMRFNKMLCRR